MTQPADPAVHHFIMRRLKKHESNYDPLEKARNLLSLIHGLEMALQRTRAQTNHAILLLHSDYNWTWQEIGSELSISEDAAFNRGNRARTK